MSTVRSLLVRLGVKADTEQVETFHAAVEGVKTGMINAAAAVAGFAAAVAAATAGTWVAVAAVTDHAEALTQTAQTLGITRAEWQELRHVFDQFPAGAEGALQILGKINLSVDDLRMNSATAMQGWKALGISLKDVENSSIPDVLDQLAAGFARTEDKQKRLVALNRIFGEDLAAKVAPALAGGAAGIAELRAAARGFGLVLEDDVLDNMNRLKGSMQTVRAVAANLGYRLAASLAPAVESMTDLFLEWYEVNNAWIRLKFEDAGDAIRLAFHEIANAAREVDTTVRDTFGSWEAVFTGAVKALAFVGLPAALGAIGLAAVAAGSVAIPAILAISTPALIAAGAVVGLVVAFSGLAIAFDDLYTWLRGGDSVFGRWLEWLGINTAALGTTRATLASAGEAVGAFGDLLAALLAPLGGASGMLDTVTGAVLGAYRAFGRFIGARITVPLVGMIGASLERLTVVLNTLTDVVTGARDPIAELANAFRDAGARMAQALVAPTLALGGLLDLVPGFDGLALPAGLSVPSPFDLAAPMGSALGFGAAPSSSTTIGDLSVNVSVAGTSATADEIGRVASDMLAARLRSAADAARGGVR